MYPKPMPALYNAVIQEFLVQSHLARVNVAYEYDEVGAWIGHAGRCYMLGMLFVLPAPACWVLKNDVGSRNVSTLNDCIGCSPTARLCSPGQATEEAVVHADNCARVCQCL